MHASTTVTNTISASERLLDSICSKEFCDKELGKISGIYFTRREVDVIACITSGRTVKKIASFLSISSKTAENHIRNIMLKLKCNSQESIRDFVENSDKYLMIKQHYLFLLLSFAFGESLKEIRRLVSKKSFSCTLVYEGSDKNDVLLLKYLKEHLELAGISSSMKGNKKKQLIDLVYSSKKSEDDCVIYMVPKERIKELYALDQNSSQDKDTSIFLLANKGFFPTYETKISPRIIFFDLNKQENYYFLAFMILKAIILDINLEKIIIDFKRQYYKVEAAIGTVTPAIISEEIISFDKKNSTNNFFVKILENNSRYLLILCVFFLSVICALYFFYKKTNKPNLTQSKEIQLIHSDFLLPKKDILLQRPHLVSQIENKLKGKENIKTVVLVGIVGIGGSGKTTLARYYAKMHPSFVVWEINAETKESLVNSFKDFAYALAKTKEQKEELVFIQQIQNSDEREKQLLSFVKNSLRQHHNWLLIYDNVDAFSDIKNFFPYDSKLWGNGKVIITTRDSNITNSSYIETDNIINLGELSEEETIILFSKILYNTAPHKLDRLQQEQIKEFLKNIPYFPLDISTAAYYIKDTGITFKDYLQRINQSAQKFEKYQENLLNELGTYSKTRYGIITLSLIQLINTHKDFGDLLVLLSLLDSQNIPIDLLYTYKQEVVVDHFVYCLKKHSFILAIDDHSQSPTSIPTVSVHRNIQEITRTYLQNTLSLQRNNPSFFSVAFSAVAVLGKYVGKAMDEDDGPRVLLSVKHCERFVKHQKLLTPSGIGIIKGALGCAYNWLGNYREAAQVLTESLDILNKHCPENHESIAQVLTHLGNTHAEIGDHKKPESFIEQALLVYQKHVSGNHYKIAYTLTKLGRVYKLIGCYEKAKDNLEQALLIHQKYFPENQVDIILSLYSRLYLI